MIESSLSYPLTRVISYYTACLPQSQLASLYFYSFFCAVFPWSFAALYSVATNYRAAEQRKTISSHMEGKIRTRNSAGQREIGHSDYK